MFVEALKLAMQAISANARSFLTLLGIVIGVGVVIAMVTIGNGTTAKVSADMAKLGSNLLFVRPGVFGQGRSAGQQAVQQPGSRGVDAAAWRAVVAPLVQRSVVVVYGTESRTTAVSGTDNDFLITQDWPLAEGRSFLPGEQRSGRAVCIVGRTVREALFSNSTALGQRIRVKKVSCEVIGVLEAKGQSGFGTDQDDIILMPLRTMQRRIAGNADIATIYVSARASVPTARVQADIERLLRERRKIEPGESDNFSVGDMKQIVQMQTATTTVLTGLLAAVAGVSLLVGGIGIMNIMLVSVTERTREIGIRLAVGAQESQVMTQFLVEAVVLSLLGGVIGVVSGLALAALAASGMQIPLVVDPVIVLVAFGFSAVVGVLFGYFPARRAARLDPIDALRHQ
ncbi:MAG: ABC transporter permease [Burkholderiaceae bacterium]